MKNRILICKLREDDNPEKGILQISWDKKDHALYAIQESGEEHIIDDGFTCNTPNGAIDAAYAWWHPWGTYELVAEYQDYINTNDLTGERAYNLAEGGESRDFPGKAAIYILIQGQEEELYYKEFISEEEDPWLDKKLDGFLQETSTEIKMDFPDKWLSLDKGRWFLV